MPHIVVEYSPGLANRFNVAALLQELHQTLGRRADAKVDPERVTSRATKADHAIIGIPGQSPPDFIHIQLKLMYGRSVEMRKNMAAELQSVTKVALMQEDIESCRVTVEVVELDSETYCP